MTSSVLAPIEPHPYERLAAMSEHQRLAAYRQGELNRAELHSWAALYPEEVPLVNGELPWIVVDLE